MGAAVAINAIAASHATESPRARALTTATHR
jgi:hypothetical protein